MKSLRDIFRFLPADGAARDAIRAFNLAPKVKAKAQSVKDLAEKLGFDVEQVDLPRGMSGRLVSDPFAENGYRIEVNRKQSVEARRWAVLHEMGHFFRHSDHSDPFAFDMHLDRSDAAFYLDQNEEREANEFAEVVLFGDGALEAANCLYGGDIENLKRHFGVSETTLRIALKKL